MSRFSRGGTPALLPIETHAPVDIHALMRRCALALWMAPQQGLLRMRRRRSSEETQLVELSPAAMANHVGETYFPLIHAACSSIAFMAVVHRHGWAVQRPEADVGEAAVRPRKGCQRGRVQTSHQRTPRQGCASPPFPSLTAHPSTPPDLAKPMTPPCSPSDAPYAANGQRRHRPTQTLCALT